MKKSFWLNENEWDEDGWVEVSEAEFFKAAKAAGFESGFFAGSPPTTYFSTSSAVKYKRGKVGKC